MQNNGNPNDLLHQVIGNMSDEQKKNLFKQAENYGCPRDILTKIQNIK